MFEDAKSGNMEMNLKKGKGGATAGNQKGSESFSDPIKMHRETGYDLTQKVCPQGAV